MRYLGGEKVLDQQIVPCQLVGVPNHCSKEPQSHRDEGQEIKPGTVQADGSENKSKGRNTNCIKQESIGRTKHQLCFGKDCLNVGHWYFLKVSYFQTASGGLFLPFRRLLKAINVKDICQIAHNLWRVELFGFLCQWLPDNDNLFKGWFHKFRLCKYGRNQTSPPILGECIDKVADTHSFQQLDTWSTGIGGILSGAADKWHQRTLHLLVVLAKIALMIQFFIQIMFHFGILHWCCCIHAM
mmetsp:Transcript_14988/g.36557  ORF Transcript_14988/g.36557 Transcript_14988/m.36557 type:complete len:241 (-) Transcript_14988:139-861(-)